MNCSISTSAKITGTHKEYSVDQIAAALTVWGFTVSHVEKIDSVVHLRAVFIHAPRLLNYYLRMASLGLNAKPISCLTY